jgi:hypothetical protein
MQYLSINPSISLSIYPSLINQSIHQSIYQSINPSISPSIYLSLIYQTIHSSIIPSMSALDQITTSPIKMDGWVAMHVCMYVCMDGWMAVVLIIIIIQSVKEAVCLTAESDVTWCDGPLVCQSTCSCRLDVVALIVVAL